MRPFQPSNRCDETYLNIRRHGAWEQSDSSCKFYIWCPFSNQVELQLMAPQNGTIEMTRDEHGYWQASVPKIYHGQRYCYLLNGQKSYPDPASFWQPEGIGQPSAVVDHSLYQWRDNLWGGLKMEDLIIYELHIGCFSPAGDFDGVLSKLDYLLDLGITAIELMPVAQFPGIRNWGYDGVFPYAVQVSYGGTGGLKRLVDSCHQRGISVVLDVVYNHLGPEGNCLNNYGPYFLKDKYHTPWGQAINYDDCQSDEVRRFFIENALYWFEHFHIDALRLDAIQAINDASAYPFLQELAKVVLSYNEKSGKPHLLIAESDRNDPKIIKPSSNGGFGLDAQWNDDFHHALHAVITGDASSYYCDYGSIQHFAKTYLRGFTYTGEYSNYRQRHHGASTEDVPASSFVVFSQNHDQVGNRLLSERLISIAGFEAAKMAAASVILSPMIPLLFMGEEWGEDSPFFYFADFEDEALRKLIKEGRHREFLQLNCRRDAADPFLENTFLHSKLKWKYLGENSKKRMLEFYQELITLRKTVPALKHCSFANVEMLVCSDDSKVLVFKRVLRANRLLYFFNFNNSSIQSPTVIDFEGKLIIATSDVRFNGGGPDAPTILESKQTILLPPHSLTLFEGLTYS